MKMLMLLSVIVSIVYPSSSSPTILMALILTQAVLICLAAWVMLKTSWFSYILFLIFLGGLMVLFIYIVSLASNEKMLVPNLDSPMKMMLIASLTSMMIANQLNKDFLTTIIVKHTQLFLNMYSGPMFFLTMATMIYLLLTLIVVVKVSSKFNAPIKNLIY